MIKKIALFSLIIFSTSYSQFVEFGKAKGLFMGLGVGARIPVGKFSDSHIVGGGLDVSFSYTDNKFLPVFFYAQFGFQHHSGRQGYYKKTDYSSISTNLLNAGFGARYYFKPLFENVVILMPVVEMGGNFVYYEKLHQFKIGSGKTNFTEESSKTGLHIGAGVSMFMLDVMGYYTFLKDFQFISFELKIRIPIYVNI